MACEAGKAGTRQALAAVAREKALLPFRGGEGGNIAPLVAPFPKWSVAEADRLWCAAPGTGISGPISDSPTDTGTADLF